MSPVGLKRVNVTCGQGWPGYASRMIALARTEANRATSATELVMDIQTTRFGVISVEDERIMTFSGGLLGFPEHRQFALIQTGEENYFFWLQSVEDPNLAFVITDPSTFFQEYAVPIREETQTEIELENVGEAQTFVICNKVGEWLTGNLLGPLVINERNRKGSQVVLTDKKWTTRQPLLKLQPEPVQLAKSA
jgi:flagellar assembly factor FliW